MVDAMFENATDKHYRDEEIRELVARMWEWQWQVGRSVLDASTNNAERRRLSERDALSLDALSAR